LPPRRSDLRVHDILDAIGKIQRYVAGLTFEQFSADQKTVDAVVRNLEVIGEAARHLLADEESILPPGVSWIEIAGMRNLLRSTSTLESTSPSFGKRQPTICRGCGYSSSPRPNKRVHVHAGGFL